MNTQVLAEPAGRSCTSSSTRRRRSYSESAYAAWLADAGYRQLRLIRFDAVGVGGVVVPAGPDGRRPAVIHPSPSSTLPTSAVAACLLATWKTTRHERDSELLSCRRSRRYGTTR
jgi:hypothetical protein